MRLEQWSCIPSLRGSVYAPPIMLLRGRNSDGEFIRTSSIDKINGNVITTLSGSVYELGDPAPEYVEFCKQQGCRIPTPEEPIKCLSS
jgi:hypothetical protein